MKRASMLIAIGIAAAMLMAGAVVYSTHAFSGEAANARSDTWLDTAVVPLSVNSQLSLDGQADPSAPSGVAILQVSEDTDAVNYQIWVANIAPPTEVTINQGSEKLVQLYPTDRGPIGDSSGNFTGLLARGTFTASDLVGPAQGQSISDFVSTLKSGQLNVNVPTVSAPNGVISGQASANTIWDNAKLVTLLPEKLTSNMVSNAAERLGISSEVVTEQVVSHLEGRNIGSAVWDIPWGGAIISNEGGALHYGVWAFNLAGITEVTLSKGGTELANQSVASLFSGTGPAADSIVRGEVAEGRLNQSDLAGPLQGHNISELVQAIDSGDVVITLDPAQNGVGALRAQPYTLTEV